MRSSSWSSRRSRWLVLLLVSGAAAGCGDGGEAAGGAADPVAATPTKPAFIARADRICRATVRRITAASSDIRAAAARTGGLAPRESVERLLVETSLPAYEDMLDELRGLRPPRGDKPAIDRYIASMADAIEQVRASPAEYARTSSSDPFSDANELAGRYGLKACGS